MPAPARKLVPAAQQASDAPNAFSVREALFIDAMVQGMKQTDAGIAAGIPPKSAATQACAMLKRPHVAAEIRRRLAERTARIEMNATELLSHMEDMVRADARELAAYEVRACRYCHGESHRYHYSHAEFEQAKDAHALRVEQFVLAGKEEAAPKFDPKGGPGFNPRRAPNPDCPSCHGEGEGDVVLKDTRKLSPAAAKLYAGARKTAHGIEIRMHDKLPVMARLASHLGIGKDVDVSANVTFIIEGDPAARRK